MSALRATPTLSDVHAGVEESCCSKQSSVLSPLRTYNNITLRGGWAPELFITNTDLYLYLFLT